MNNNNTDFFCNNCGKQGHNFHQCKMPITSNGVIAFRIVPYTNELQFLMIRRKDTLGYMDFMRGKFPVFQKQYILNMLYQMTVEERNKLRQRTISYLNNDNKDPLFHNKEKIQMLMKGVETNIIDNIVNESYDLLSLLNEADQTVIWNEPEWGFPKGRRNSQEKDYDCALREFSEETGYHISILNNIRNIIPFEEIFIGSNYKVYRHKYYLMNISYNNSLTVKTFQKSEVSGMEWKNFNQAIYSIRSYNLEKKQMLTNIYNCLTHTLFCSVKENTNDNDNIII
jgi:8-oxo-dGTP pyrophosphatase MutT (NUDIX family)